VGGGDHRGRRNGNQWSDPVRAGGLETAQETPADSQPECVRSVHVCLSGRHLFDEDQSHLSHRCRRVLQKKLLLVY